MDEQTKAAYHDKAKDLRAELKRWENEWAHTHDGKKPGRQDIKDNAEIARKYKDYNKYRDILSGKLPPPSERKPKSKKRQPDPAPAATPLKRTKYAETPSKQRAHDDEPMSTPAISRKLFSPAPVTCLGPTPQRDGHVLGLFDLLVESELGTPSRRDNHPRTPSRAGVNTLSTPSRRTEVCDAESTTKPGRTPISSSRKQMLNMFATPMKNRRGSVTPSSVSKLQFDTPAFLKRHPLPAVDEKALFADAAPLRLPRKPLVRGLSEIVASLRKVEEDVLDDDLEALREVENGATDVPRPTSSSMRTKPALAPAPPSVLEPDTQGRPILLGGFDNEDTYDSPQEDTVHRNGIPPPTFKKKTQKRTTRKVNIKPTMKKRPQAVADHASEDDEPADSETQIPPLPDGDYASSTTIGPVKKLARKVNELAHANFKRLKLRNHGAKGGPGFNSRFRRRR